MCESQTAFTAHHAWLRDHYRCDRCGSIPRERALLTVLGRTCPRWRDADLHESSPGLPSSQLLARSCPGYVGTHYFPDQPLGEHHRGFRNEDLSRQTFADETFDLVVSQDVMEHVLDPQQSFREIARTLRPGGAHVSRPPSTPISREPRSARG